MRRLKKFASLFLTLAMTAAVLTGCGGDGSGGKTGGSDTPAGNTQTQTQQPEGGTDESPAAEALWKSLDPGVSGEISIMCWSGDSVYYEDIGGMDLKDEDITTQNVAAIYAMAKQFKELYPNVKINLWAKLDDPNGNETTWEQELENFKAEHGKYPDIYASTDLAGDTARGLVADLSYFADDVLYKSFNESLMANMNYFGFQAGLPQFVQPWGVWVNKELAENNNIDVPGPDWTIDEYTDFVTAADNKTFWGMINIPVSYITSGSGTIGETMLKYDGSGDRVNVASESVMALLDYIPKWGKTEIWTQFNNGGNVTQEIVDDGWWWGYRFFCRNYCLTYDGDPWMFNAAALGQNEDGTWATNAIESNDWDYYPRPSTEWAGNSLGICVDPMAVHNYAMDDGNAEWSETEIEQFTLAYAFGSYWCGSTEAMQARADQNYSDNGTIKSCLNDSFPLVTGEEFDKQMDIWYSTDTHARYGDADKMPGFQYCMELWQQGAIYDVSDKTYLYFVNEDGEQKICLYEMVNISNAEVAGAQIEDANFVDTVKAKLPDWNEKINARFTKAEESLKEGLKTYYGYTDADF